MKGLAYPLGAVSRYGWERFTKYRIEPAFFRSSSMAVINLDKFNALPKADQDLLNKVGLDFENNSGAMYLKRAIVDAQKQDKAGVKVLKLTGDVGKAYLGTIYGSKWKQNAKYKYTIPFEKLKAMMYK